VGDDTGTPEYSPVTLNFSSGTFSPGNYVGVNLSNLKYPSDPNTGSYLNRYWNLSSTGITGFNATCLFQYTPADIAGTEAEIFSMQVAPAPFTDFGLADAVLHQLTTPDLTAFGTFTGSQPRPYVLTTPATLIDATTATLNGEVTANFNASSIEFEYGLTTSYGTTVPGNPLTVSGGVAVPASANIAGLSVNTTYHFRINGTNIQGVTYGNDLTFTTTCPVPSAAGTVTGPVNVCMGGSGYVYTVPAITNATDYAWTLPSGASVTAGANTNTITVSFSTAAVSGNVTVGGTSVCGNGTVSAPLAVTVIPQPVPVITGPANACISSSGNIYATEPGMTGYTWSVSAGGTITGGASTDSITVSWATAGPQTVSVSYTNSTGCTAAAPTVYAVNVVPLPVPSIAGPNIVCANAANIIYTTEPGMTNYNWAVSIGGTIVAGAGTNAITVSWPYAGNRTVSVAYTNPTGCATLTPTVFNVTINPAAVPTIGSSNDPCINSTGNQYITNSGMSNYTWDISPGGTITSGLGTNTIYVTWNTIGAQWVSVGFTNSFGCTTVNPAVYNLFVNPLPSAAGAVTGTPALCAGTQGVAYSCNEINNATSYSWTLPAGATIATGAGTRNITVNFSLVAVSGNITVAGQNSCGVGAASPNYAVTVHPVPPAPMVTAVGNLLTSSAPAGNQWYFQGNPIPAATGQTYTATLTGYYSSVVTLNGCTSPESNKVLVVITGQQELPGTGLAIYPVPNNGQFSIEIQCQGSEDYSLRIYNQTGRLVFKKSDVPVHGFLALQVDLQNEPPGVYSVAVSNRLGIAVRKIVITR
jgi:hypothetical protein